MNAFMDKQEFFESLGLSEYESKTILALIRLNIATTREISFNSGVPQNKLYRVLEKLSSLGVVETIPEKLRKYRIINLDYFIKERVKEKENSLKQVKQSAKKFKNLDEHDEKSMFSIIKGQQAIMNKLADHNWKVKKEIFGVQRNWKVWAGGLRSLHKSIKKGVDVRLIGVVNDSTKSKAKEWEKTGAKIRKYNDKFGTFPLRFTIFDGKEARITIGKPDIPDPENYITIWTKSKPLINILRKQFLDMWKKSETL